MRLPRLTIDAEGPSEGGIVLSDYVWLGATPDLAVHANVDDSRTLVRSRGLVEEDAAPGARVRWVEYFEIDAVTEDGDPAGPLPSDLVRFDLDATTFAETGRWRPDDDRNLHRRAFSLPMRLERGASVLPVAAARATLDWCGRARVRLGDQEAELDLARIRLEQGGMQMDQWLARGVGEIAMGRSYGPFIRWALAWAGGDRALFGGIPAEIAALSLPDPDLDREGAEVRGLV